MQCPSKTKATHRKRVWIHFSIITTRKAAQFLPQQNAAMLHHACGFIISYSFFFRIICGLSQFTTKHHIARAALEAVCFQTREVSAVIHSLIQLHCILSTRGNTVTLFMIDYLLYLISHSIGSQEVSHTVGKCYVYMKSRITWFLLSLLVFD